MLMFVVYMLYDHLHMYDLLSKSLITMFSTTLHGIQNIEVPLHMHLSGLSAFCQIHIYGLA